MYRLSVWREVTGKEAWKRPFREMRLRAQL